jgi:23S rRNA pseudouridine2605 synthase
MIEGTIRLQKLMAMAGPYSRREAEALIRDARVTVNDVEASLGQSVDPQKDKVCVDGRPLQKVQEHLYLLLNKPKGVVSTVNDPEGRPTVLSILPEVPERIFPVGRLDFNTEGLLLMTNDGRLTQALIHPKAQCPKVYLAKIAGTLTLDELQRVERGITYDGVRYGRCRVVVLTRGNNNWVQVTLTEGKNHQVRNMFAAVNHPVSKLRRISFAGLTPRGMAIGEYRILLDEEVAQLKAGRYQSKRPLDPYAVLEKMKVVVSEEDRKHAYFHLFGIPYHQRGSARPVAAGPKRPRVSDTGVRQEDRQESDRPRRVLEKIRKKRPAAAPAKGRTSFKRSGSSTKRPVGPTRRSRPKS